ncbi:MAG: hypothetical protein ACJ73D_08815 [Pyrinomonadaceae bacterium]
MARRHVLGNYYSRCEDLAEQIPVFVEPSEGTTETIPSLVGHVDQALGHYADAYTFHLSPEICKQLSSGYFSYRIEFEFADPKATNSRSRIRLSSISLIARQSYSKPIPRGKLTVNTE